MIVEYEDSGRIFHVLRDPIDSEVREIMLSRPNALEVEECNIQTDFVQDGKILPRPSCPTIVYVDGRTISLEQVPDGSTVTVILEGVHIEIAEDSFEIDEPGPLSILVQPPFPYLERRYDLEIE